MKDFQSKAQGSLHTHPDNPDNSDVVEHWMRLTNCLLTFSIIFI